METYDIEAAKENLSQLLSDVRNGKHVEIEVDDNCRVKLVPASARKVKPRKAGSARGKFKMSDDFDAPLPEFEPYT